MSKKSTMRNNAFYIFVCIYILLAIGSTDGCRDGKPMSNLDFVGIVEIYKDGVTVPLNDRLVIVYANGKEVGRSISNLGQFEPIDNVPDDGLFVVTVPNEYELTRDQVGKSGTGTVSKKDNLIEMKIGNSMFLNIGERLEGFCKKNKN